MFELCLLDQGFVFFAGVGGVGGLGCKGRGAQTFGKLSGGPKASEFPNYGPLAWALAGVKRI